MKKTAWDPVLRWMLNNGALVGLIVLCVAMFIATPHFLTVPNLLNVGVQAATVAGMVDPAHWPWHRPTGWPYQRHLDCIWKASSIHRHPGDDVHRPRRNPGDFPGLPRAEF